MSLCQQTFVNNVTSKFTLPLVAHDHPSFGWSHDDIVLKTAMLHCPVSERSLVKTGIYNQLLLNVADLLMSGIRCLDLMRF